MQQTQTISASYSLKL